MVSEHDDRFCLVRIGDGTWTDKVQPPAESKVATDLVAVPYIVLEDGDGDEVDGGEQGTPIESLYVSRNDYDTANTYNIDAVQTLNFCQLVPDEVGDEEAKEAWLDARRGIVEDFMSKRYNAQLDGSSGSWSFVRAEMRASHVGPITPEQACSIAWEETKTVDLYNEYDAGTFGSEYLGRLLTDECSRFTIPILERGDGVSVTEADITREISFRTGERELRDRTAMAIVTRLVSAEPTGTPHLRALNVFGYAETDKINDELRELYASAVPSERRQLDMLFTWNLNGGDNT